MSRNFKRLFLICVFSVFGKKRLLSDRVPYAVEVETYPEGGRRHLSAESALFCRIISEGLLEIVPKGLRQFSFTPKLPSALDHLSLTNIHAFGRVFDLYVDKSGYRVSAADGKEISCGKNGREVPVIPIPIRNMPTEPQQPFCPVVAALSAGMSLFGISIIMD